MSQISDTRIGAITDTALLWRTIYGEAPGLLALLAGRRTGSGRDTKGRLTSTRTTFFRYPDDVVEAARWSAAASEQGLESYYCAHLLMARRRTKNAAAPVLALWADADGPMLADAPEPTAVVESSPGRAHLFWRLRRSLSPTAAEALNQRLAFSLGADPSGWDLSQLLRPPGTRNLKYEAMPTVELVALDEGAIYHTRELDLTLPEMPAVPERISAQVHLEGASACQAGPYSNEFSSLSDRAKNLIRMGNAGSGDPYESRSEADFAVCLAMFSAGYDEYQIHAVLTDPANGISEKYHDKGRHGESYLMLTLRKACLHARGPEAKNRPGKRPRCLKQRGDL